MSIEKPLSPKPQEPLDMWLERAFTKVEELEIEGKKIRVLDIAPPQPKTEVPVTLAPGYGTSSPYHNKVNILEMVKHGRRTLFIDEPRGIPHAPEAEGVDESKVFFLNQAAALMAVLDKKGIGKTDIVAHSEGCMYAMVAAALHPERFRNIVLFNPGGMVGDDTFLRLMFRFLSEGLAGTPGIDQEKVSDAAKEQLRFGGEGFKKYLLSDTGASVKELHSMAALQIRSLIKHVKESGVGISIVHGAHDKVFPMERVQAQTKRATPDEELIVDGFYSVLGGHGGFVVDPETFTYVADSALTSLEKKYAKTATGSESS